MHVVKSILEPPSGRMDLARKIESRGDRLCFIVGSINHQSTEQQQRLRTILLGTVQTEITTHSEISRMGQTEIEPWCSGVALVSWQATKFGSTRFSGGAQGIFNIRIQSVETSRGVQQTDEIIHDLFTFITIDDPQVVFKRNRWSRGLFNQTSYSMKVPLFDPERILYGIFNQRSPTIAFGFVPTESDYVRVVSK